MNGCKKMISNLEYYRVFYNVAKYQNITKAAHELFVSQPSVTKMIHKLEKQLDCILFERTKKGVTLTPEGELLYKSVQPAYEMILSCESEILDRKQLKTGVLRIASSEVTIKNYLLPKLEKFRMLYPEIQIKIEHVFTSNVESILMSGIVDFAILGSPMYNENFKVKVLECFEDVLVAGDKYSFLSDKVLTLQELNNYPIITMIQSTGTREYYNKIYESYNLMLKPSIELSDIELILLLTERNFGISFVPEIYVHDKLKDGRLHRLKIEEDILNREIYLVHCFHRPLSIAAKAFFEIL